MGYYVEVWTRPGHASFGRLIDDPPFREGSWHDGLNYLGDGTLQMPNSFTRFDEILYIDRQTLANSVSSLVRIVSDLTGEVVGEWIPNGLAPTSAKNDPFVEVFGQGIKSILTYAVTQPWDWDGSATFIPDFPDWIYGGPNILSNPGFEDQGCQSRQYELHINATGGTYTLSDGTDTTAALNHNSTDGAIEAALEGFTAIDDINVSPIPLAAGDTFAFLFEFVDPCVGVSLTVNPASLTGGTVPRAVLTQTQAGVLTPASWMKSQQVSTGTPREFGVYDVFAPSMVQAHSGSWSLSINPGAVNSRIEAFAGAQQIVNVKPGGLYQASIWVFPTAASQTYRLVIRGLDEDLIAFVNVSPPANVWTQVTISDIVIPDGDDRVIFRFANTNLSGNPALFYIDDAAFNEGQAAASIGKILGDLYDDATIDHAGRVVWEDDANPGTAYLTLDFSDTLDSGGAAWDKSDLSVKVWQRMDYLQVMQLAVDDFGYEWRIVPDDPEAGTWLWQVYNPGTMDDAPDVAILGGSSDVSRQLRRFLPRTAHMVEGELRATARSSSAGLVTALGRIETARLGRSLPTMPAIIDAAAEDSDDAVISGNPWSYELVDPQVEPGSAWLVAPAVPSYRIGDTITVHDPPEADGEGRLWDWVLTLTPEKVTHEIEVLEEV